jgi:2-methylisocitrate lyase-like PEP mutase family enzyme
MVWAMTQQAERARAFARLHRPGQPLLMPNAWDAGSAKLLAWLGFEALATTSSGFAATLGRLDGSVTREEAVEHSAAMVAATNLPVSADLESGFAEDSNGVAETAGGAVTAGLAGFSIEDFARDGDEPIYPLALAVERVAAAAEVAHAGPVHLVLTARCENFLHGRPDLDDTIARLRAYQGAGADVLFAPGLTTAEQISTVISAVDKPLNVLVGSQSPPVAELAALGVSRISVGGAFAFAALSTLMDAARELREQGTYGYTARAAEGMRAARAAFD